VQRRAGRRRARGPAGWTAAPPAGDEQTGWTRADWIAASAAFLAAALTFANSLPNGFALDDTWLIEQNVKLRFLHNLPELLTDDYWEPKTRSALWRPAATLSYALNVAAGGPGPLGFHTVNVLLHALASALVFGTLARLTGDRLVAAGTALLFATHAVHTEVVAGVASGRPELLAAVFLLAAWWLHVAREGRRSGIPWTAPILASYAVATLSKESALFFPPAIALGDLLFRTDAAAPLGARVRQLLARHSGRYLGFAAVAAGSLLLRARVLGSLAPTADLRDAVTNPLFDLPAGWRMLNALWIVALDLGLLAAPIRLAYDYAHAQIPLIASLADPRVAVVPLAVAAGAAWVWTFRRAPIACFAAGFFALTLVMVSNLLVPIGTMLSERLLYVPSLGFCLGVAWAAAAIARRAGAARGRALFAVLIALLAGGHAARSVERNPDWKDSPTLFLHDLETAPRSVKVQDNAGWVLLLSGDSTAALACFERAIELGKGPAWFLNPYHGRTYALWELGRRAEAREAYALFVRHGGSDPRLDQVVGGQVAPGSVAP
jgi:hypothetical protein